MFSIKSISKNRGGYILNFKLINFVLFVTISIFFCGCDGSFVPGMICSEDETREEVILDSFRVAFEDVDWIEWDGGNCQGYNDYDYEDCVCDIDIEGSYICDDRLKEIKFSVTYQNDGTGNIGHEFGLRMPEIFIDKLCTYNLNGITSSIVTCPGEFIFFQNNKAKQEEVFHLSIIFEKSFVYDYKEFTHADIHGNLIDIKPFINTYWDIDDVFKEKIIAGNEDKRILLVPSYWQWSPGVPLWDCYAEVVENNCYPEFIDPGTWTWIR